MTRQQIELEFAVLMAREFPTAHPLPSILADLIRLSRRHARLQERACNEGMPEGYDERCEKAIRQICALLGCEPIFGSDPRGCTVKLKVPSGKTNDFGGEGICVPQ